MRLSLTLLACALTFVGCTHIHEPDRIPPAVPRGVHSVTGDQNVRLYWYPNHEPDFDGYNVYRSYSLVGPYYVIGSTPTAYFIDHQVVNGQTYYYAVSAYDVHCNESELSYDVVFDTPRPEGYNVLLWNFHIFPLDAGFNFSQQMVQPYNSWSTDIYFEIEPISLAPYVNVGHPDTDIQDFGYIDCLDDINYAPETGWSSLGYVEAIEGHGYIIWTWDNHFAKFRIEQIEDDYMRMDWAYQVDPGNPELVKGP